jgi:hypothetical protein
MSDSAVKQGYTYKPPLGVAESVSFGKSPECDVYIKLSLQAEAFSSHTSIHEVLSRNGHQNLRLLGDFLTEILARRGELLPPIGYLSPLPIDFKRSRLTGNVTVGLQPSSFQTKSPSMIPRGRLGSLTSRILTFLSANWPSLFHTASRATIF